MILSVPAMVWMSLPETDCVPMSYAQEWQMKMEEPKTVDVRAHKQCLRAHGKGAWHVARGDPMDVCAIRQNMC